MKVGDRVVCVNAGKLKVIVGQVPRLIKGREYIVFGMKTCGCGIKTLDVGLWSDAGGTTCDCNIKISDGIHWCAAERFRKVEEKVRVIRISES